MERDERNGADPRQLAELLAKVIAQPSPGIRYPIGGLSERFGVALRRVLPASLLEKAIRATYKV